MSVNSAVTDTCWSPNYSPGRPGAPTSITIHHWGVDGQQHQKVVNYLCNPNRPNPTSAHYVASEGRVTQLVHDYDRAWHAGPSGNPRSIGIECRPEMTRGDFETVARLIAAIRSEWGHLPLLGHRQWMATDCPGRWYPRLGDLSTRADQLASGTTTTQEDDDMAITDDRFKDLVRAALVETRGTDGRNVLDSIIQTRSELKDRAVDALIQTKGLDGRNVLDRGIQNAADIAALAARLGALEGAITRVAAGGTDPEIIMRAAHDGAASALADLTLTAKKE